jgi:hypothetical protein
MFPEKACEFVPDGWLQGMLGLLNPHLVDEFYFNTTFFLLDVVTQKELR